MRGQYCGQKHHNKLIFSLSAVQRIMGRIITPDHLVLLYFNTRPSCIIVFPKSLFLFIVAVSFQEYFDFDVQ